MGGPSGAIYDGETSGLEVDFATHYSGHAAVSVWTSEQGDQCSLHAVSRVHELGERDRLHIEIMGIDGSAVNRELARITRYVA